MLEVSWSELKTFQRCPKQWDYKYDQRLVPKKKVRPLFLGSWIHACLESHYKQGDWKLGHALYLAEWNKLFDEEKLALRTRGKTVGPPLPELVERIMRSYLWYYRGDGWKVYAVEQKFKFEVTVDGLTFIFKGIIDLIIEDEEGHLWIIDHKSASTIPEATAFHAMDPQLMLYPWGAEIEWGLEVTGIIYNYVKSKPPSIPQINKDGSLSRRKILTDFPTAVRFFRENGYDPNDFRDILLPLRKRSPFLRRYRLPREDYVTNQIVADARGTIGAIAAGGHRSRTITRDCARMCPYHDLCRAELNGFDTEHMRKMDFTIKPQDEEAVDIFIDADDDEGEEED